jgi:hypothetical protein
MKEASLAKYYFAKYFFLAFGLMQWVVVGILVARYGSLPKTLFAALLFFTLGLICIAIFALASDKLRRVAIGKKKIAVIEKHRVKRYEWPKVKSIRQIPFLNMYAMKIKGRKGKVYFLPTHHTESIFGLASPSPEETLKSTK